MLCNKLVFAATAMVATSLAHAAVDAGPVKPAPATGAVASVSAVSSSTAPLAVPAPVVAESHLLLGQINDAARAKVLKSLREPVQPIALNQPAAPTFGQIPAPAINQIPTFPATLAPSAADSSAARAAARPRIATQDDGVSIVGTAVDGQSSRVLYSYNGGIYSAPLGQKMLNGATAKSINGLKVTVTNGKRTWDVPVAAAFGMGSDSN